MEGLNSARVVRLDMVLAHVLQITAPFGLHQSVIVGVVRARFGLLD